MKKLKKIGWSAAKEIYSLAVFVIKLLLILAITIPIIIIWLYIILTFDGSQIDEISFSQFVAVATYNIFHLLFLFVCMLFIVFWILIIEKSKRKIEFISTIPMMTLKKY